MIGLRFALANPGSVPVEIGALGMPMVFNNILSGRDLEEAHARCSFSDPYIGGDAGYIQVTRLTGLRSTLVVVPFGGTPFEAYNPLLTDPTRRGVTFEGFYEWVAHSKALAEEDWRDAEPWNPPTSTLLAPGESRKFKTVIKGTSRSRKKSAGRTLRIVSTSQTDGETDVVKAPVPTHN